MGWVISSTAMATRYFGSCSRHRAHSIRKSGNTLRKFSKVIFSNAPRLDLPNGEPRPSQLLATHISVVADTLAGRRSPVVTLVSRLRSGLSFRNSTATVVPRCSPARVARSVVGRYASASKKMTARWSDFQQPHRPHWNYAALGPFVFDKVQYEETLALVIEGDGEQR